MVVRKGFSILQGLVVADDGLGVVACVEADAAEVIPGFEAMEFGAVLAVILVGGKGEGVVGEVNVVLVEGFAEEEGVEGPDVEARQVPGLQAPQDCQGAVRPLRHQRLHIIQRPTVT